MDRRVANFTEALKSLGRLTQVETIKFWRKGVAQMVFVLLFIGPASGEFILVRLSPRDAIFPRVSNFLLSADLLMMLALITIVLSVMALGNDFDLGTVRVILSRGVDRYQFVLAKMITSLIAALVIGFFYMGAALLSIFIVHQSDGNPGFIEAAGGDILWRALAAVGVIGLVNFIMSGVVMLALVVGRSSWVGMLAGLGYFFFDFIIGGLGSGQLLGIKDAYRYTVAYYAISILEKVFPTDPALSLPRAWIEGGFAHPTRALAVMFLYGVGFAGLSIFLFRQQDLIVKD